MASAYRTTSSKIDQKLRFFVLAWITASELFLVCSCSRRNQTPLAGRKEASELAGRHQLVETDVLPHTSGPITPGRNYIYCATFQIAWSAMQEQIVREPILLDGDPPLADLLNKHKFGPADLSQDSYVAMAGSIADGIVERIGQEMRRRFPALALEIPDGLEHHAFVAYAYLEKMLSFGETFDRLQEPIVFGSPAGVAEVRAFGVRHFKHESDRTGALNQQVTLLDYASEDDFIMSLNTTSRNDELVLAKVSPEETLDATFATVRRRIQQQAGKYYPSQLMDGETLAVPIIALHTVHKYSELEGRPLRNEAWNRYYISLAVQGIRFRLDETGAQLASNAVLAFKSQPPPPTPRRFVFDKPFLIYLRELTGERPYLVMWIETPELLERLTSERAQTHR